MKKLLSLVLALMMLLGSVSAFAEGESAGGPAAEADDAGSRTISLSEEEKSRKRFASTLPWSLL